MGLTLALWERDQLTVQHRERAADLPPVRADACAAGIQLVPTTQLAQMIERSRNDDPQKRLGMVRGQRSKLLAATPLPASRATHVCYPSF
jgi:hypothetical protein